MTFQERYRFSLRSGPLRFLQIYIIIIGSIEPWTIVANSITSPAPSNQSSYEIERNNLSTFTHINSTHTAEINQRHKNDTGENNDEEETTFHPETILFQLSDRKFFNSPDKMNNTKYIRKKMLNVTMYNAKPVEPLKINPSELPVEKNRTDLPEHNLSKNLETVDLESRMLFERNKE
ncbi:uncharacterized protein [Chelonus insularis]|uniref:uncharacterized protein n=1 Tax=Chelonus insularis TaxID=460826 RepID=UPI00158D3F8B|nr:uncharacterized protein LOC118073859 [Chelonus insularis]XP_034950508.1 uncharacterized protein LOC118073859 [Chelonus insularis]